jgi:hypothetical protein
MHFTRDDIARQFDTTTFRRGAGYADDGRVMRLRRDGDRIEGEVAGSGRSVYAQTVRVRADRYGIGFSGDCTCPVGSNCKHVVALLLASLESKAAPQDVLWRVAEDWVQQLAAVHAAARAEAARAPAPDQRTDRLAWVLIPDDAARTLSLHACKLRVRKDGRVAMAAIQPDLHRLLVASPAFVAPEDEEALRLLGALRMTTADVHEIKPSGAIGKRLLDQLCTSGRLWYAQTRSDLHTGRMAPVAPGPVRTATLAWAADQEGDSELALDWRFDDGKRITDVLATEPVCYLDDGKLGELALPPALAPIPPAVLLDLVTFAPLLHPEHRAVMATRLLEQGLDGIVPAPLAMEIRERRDVAPVPHLLLDSDCCSVRGGHVLHDPVWIDYALLTFDYDGLSTEDVAAPVLRRAAGATVEVIVRDEAVEAAALRTLEDAGFGAVDSDPPPSALAGALTLPTPAAWLDFVRDHLPRLQAAGWQIDYGGDYRYDIAAVEDWYADLDEEGEGVDGWFALELGVLVNGARYPLLPLLLEMIRRAPEDFDAQALAARDDASELLVDLSPSTRVALPWARIKPILATLGELYFAERMGDGLRLPVIDAARLAELDAAAQMRWLGGERLRELGRKLGGFDGVHAVAAPAGLQAQLRPYQLSGLAWMQFLREYGFGGILADDMGLGKTIQTLAHILAEKEAGRLDAPALVVAPTSLMGNWQAEAARFAPGLRVLLLHGKDRKESFDQVAGADIVLTTYALLGRDEDALRRHRYHLLILDEAQYIKNSRAKAAQVVRLLDARHRLCLTGTPVQNHLGELWSQFHFLMPGLLGNEKTFNAHYRKPIEGRGDTLRKDLLVRRLKPFMLRRTKDRVATELPPKTEIVLPVDFGAAQRDLYETVRLAMDRKVRDEIDRKGLARSQIVILDALLKLRQVCCDPRLLKGGAAAGSGKLEALMELLDTLLSEGRKVLVFSQFTSMLALIEAELRARAVAYALLTGDTADRDAQVADFQQGRVGVFLISLKAGGVGLNLTAADTVIHYDPWWNPASENQATDRAWRIGQTQPVFVYKLIARGTLEEKIQDMQRRKGDLANALLDSGEADVSLKLGADDLQAIFAPL